MQKENKKKEKEKELLYKPVHLLDQQISSFLDPNGLSLQLLTHPSVEHQPR